MTTMNGYTTRTFANQFNTELGKLFGTVAQGYQATEATQWVPAVDIYEDDNAYKLCADIVGVDPAEVSIEIDNGILTLKGARKSRSDDADTVVSRSECPAGEFVRTFTLPDNIDSDSVTAKTEFGVLQVTIPRQAKPEPKRIKIIA